MELINSYFKNLLFTRVDEKNLPDGKKYVIYGAGIEGLYGGGMQRYVLLFVPSHLAFKRQSRIHELPWENLQTRTLNYSYRLKKQSWSIPRNISDVILSVVSRNKKQGSTYKLVPSNNTSDLSSPSEFPFEVLLLHNPKKKTLFQYRNKLTLSAAIETFSAVVNYTGEIHSLMYTSGPQTAPLPVNPHISNIPNVKNWFGGGTPNIDDSYEYIE